LGVSLILRRTKGKNSRRLKVEATHGKGTYVTHFSTEDNPCKRNLQGREKVYYFTRRLPLLFLVILISPGNRVVQLYPDALGLLLLLLSKLHYDRQSVGQSVMVSGAHLGPATNFSFSLKFLLGSYCCYFVAPSLTRGRVCNLLLLLVLASAVTLRSALSDERSGLSFVSTSILLL
jgi:hypothetical protein